MFLTGFADEASPDLREQIRATEELGWKFIETRVIGDKNLGTISNQEFEEVQEILSHTDVRFNCYGSNIANWGKSPRSDADFEASRKELLTAIPRMHKLGIKLVRGMSFKRATEELFDNPDLEKVIFAKVKELVRICESEGIIYGHENCMNYGGQSWHHTLRLLDNINSDSFKLIFDTGNPTFNFSRLGPKPYKLQRAWEFYSNVREAIIYVHIKDSNSSVNEDGTVKTAYTWAGEGQGDVERIVTDLLRRGYDGGFSMEPHVAAVFHAQERTNDPEKFKKLMYSSYVEYGRRFEKLLKKCKAAANVS